MFIVNKSTPKLLYKICTETILMYAIPTKGTVYIQHKIFYATGYSSEIHL